MSGNRTSQFDPLNPQAGSSSRNSTPVQPARNPYYDSNAPPNSIPMANFGQQPYNEKSLPQTPDQLQPNQPPPAYPDPAQPPQQYQQYPSQQYPPQQYHQYPPQQYPSQQYPPQQYPPQQYPPQQYPQQNPPQQYPPQQYPPQQYPPQQNPQQQYPPQQYPSQQYPPNAYPLQPQPQGTAQYPSGIITQQVAQYKAGLFLPFSFEQLENEYIKMGNSLFGLAVTQMVLFFPLGLLYLIGVSPRLDGHKHVTASVFMFSFFYVGMIVTGALISSSFNNYYYYEDNYEYYYEYQSLTAFMVCFLPLVALAAGSIGVSTRHAHLEDLLRILDNQRFSAHYDNHPAETRVTVPSPIPFGYAESVPKAIYNNNVFPQAKPGNPFTFEQVQAVYDRCDAAVRGLAITNIIFWFPLGLVFLVGIVGGRRVQSAQQVIVSAVFLSLAICGATILASVPYYSTSYEYTHYGNYTVVPDNATKLASLAFVLQIIFASANLAVAVRHAHHGDMLRAIDMQRYVNTYENK